MDFSWPDFRQRASRPDLPNSELWCDRECLVLQRLSPLLSSPSAAETGKAISHTAGSDSQWIPARSQGLAQHTAWNQELIRLTFRDLTGSAPPQIRLLYIWKVFWACWEPCEEMSSSWSLRTSPYLRVILKITALYWHLWFHEERFTSK